MILSLMPLSLVCITKDDLLKQSHQEYMCTILHNHPPSGCT